jgi:hypothetical protein
MIQGVVSRLATFSANAKNFCITVVAALLGIAFQQHLPVLLIAAAFVVISFAALDVYYLAQERRFREFYRDVADRPLTKATELGLTPPTLTLSAYFAGIRSFSTGGFYLLLLIVGAALLPIAYERAEENGLGNTRGAAVRSDTPVAAESNTVRVAKRAEPNIGQEPQRPFQNDIKPSPDRRDVRQPISLVTSNHT